MKNNNIISVKRSRKEFSATYLLNALSSHPYILNANNNPVTGFIQPSHHVTMMAQIIEVINVIVFHFPTQLKFQEVNARKGVNNITLVKPEPIQIKEGAKIYNY